MFEYPLRRNTIPSKVRSHGQTIRQERRKPELPGPYIYVGDFDALDPPVVTWQSPPWQNNFTWLGTSYVGFRHGLDGDLEFIGRLDLTQGAVTGTVAFTLPLAYSALAFDFVFPIYTGGTDWISGIMSVDNTPGPTRGDCTVYWPVQATALP